MGEQVDQGERALPAGLIISDEVAIRQARLVPEISAGKPGRTTLNCPNDLEMAHPLVSPARLQPVLSDRLLVQDQGTYSGWPETPRLWRHAHRQAEAGHEIPTGSSDTSLG